MQPVASMTGFARLDGDVQGLGFAWELRSVNNRGLDLRLRLPAGFEGLEPRLRKYGRDIAREVLQRVAP